jgi:hypothetical protein
MEMNGSQPLKALKASQPNLVETSLQHQVMVHIRTVDVFLVCLTHFIPVICHGEYSMRFSVAEFFDELSHSVPHRSIPWLGMVREVQAKPFEVPVTQRCAVEGGQEAEFLDKWGKGRDVGLLQTRETVLRSLEFELLE